MAYLEITLNVAADNRAAAADVYKRYKKPFLDTVDGATAKDLLIREEDVQVLHTFDAAEQAEAYLASDLFEDDVVGELAPLLAGDPEIRIYEVA